MEIKKMESYREQNSFYDVLYTSPESVEACNEVLGIENNKTLEELYEELQNE